MNKQILLIAMALFSIVILLAQNNLERAFALAQFTLSTGADSLIQPEYLAVNNTLWGSNGAQKLYKISPTTHATLTTYTLSQNITGNIAGVACSSSVCYVKWDTGTLNKDRILKIDKDGAIIARAFGFEFIGNAFHLRSDGSEIFFGQLNCFGASTNCVYGVGAGVNSVTWVFGSSTQSGDCSALLPCMVISRALGSATANDNFGANTVNDITDNGATDTTARLGVVASMGASQNDVSEWLIGSGNTKACQNTADITGTASSIEYYNNGWYVTDSSANTHVDIFGNTCTVTTTVSNANMGTIATTLGADDIQIDTTHSRLIVMLTSRLVVMNLTSPTVKLLDFTGYATLASMAMTLDYNSANDQLFIVNQGTTSKFIDFGSPEAGTPETPAEGSNGNAVNGVCGNGTALDCVGSGTSPFFGITGGRNVTDITAVLTNGLGLTNCAEDGSDSETCGSGLFTFLILLLLTEFLALAGYLGFTRKTNSETNLMDIALFMLIIAFVDLSIAFYLNWIPDVVFYTIVVITASLLAFGIFSRVRGG